MKKTVVSEFILPAFWASYLINNDVSRIDDEELEAIHDFLMANGLRQCVGCEDVGFKNSHDAMEFMPLAADCALFAFWS